MFWSKIKNLKDSSSLFGANGGFVEEMYERYLANSNSVDLSWRSYFEALGKNGATTRLPSWAKDKNVGQNVSRETSVVKQSKDIELGQDLSWKILSLVSAYRERGHLLASLDPLNLEKLPGKKDICLDLDFFGIKESDLDVKVSFSSSVCGVRSGVAHQILDCVHRAYSGTIGYEFAYISNKEETEWLIDLAEGHEDCRVMSSEEKQDVLKELMRVEGFEQFLHHRFPGAKRFSIEGADNSITACNSVIKTLSDHGADSVVFGMPHRGRLSIVTSILNKPYKVVFSEFLGKFAHIEVLGLSGDVRYHLGNACDMTLKNGKKIHLSLISNPSHLEAINSVVLGKIRAEQDLIKDLSKSKIAGILFHGDASFAGQGVVMESLMMSELEGYRVGGIVHIVINNQIGFTATAKEARASRYSTEIAKIIKAPVFHVNGNCAEDVAKISRIAAEYRNKFKKDVVIEIICYRLYGHNEMDEPRFTQPIMYEKISTMDTPAKIYSDQLVAEGIIDDSYFDSYRSTHKAILEKEYEEAVNYETEKVFWFEGIWRGFVRYSNSKARTEKTGIAPALLQEIGRSLTSIPDGFNAHKTVIKGYTKRAESIKDGNNIDWATAESLAFGSLVLEGFKVRMSGQDSQRGTFSHRHSVITDQETGSRYTPLKNLAENQGDFEVINSFLSEYAVMGFEYGYSIANPKNLVLWEAQFGDFANGAQIVIDQFLVAGEVKWMRSSGLVLLLPHGYEGQGPEHSSARLERYLQLCAENNMQVVNITTPANYFHVLRRQIHSNYRKPLIIMSPKSLLRHHLAVSSINDFDCGTEFSPVLVSNDIEYKSVNKVILCSGKIYYDLYEKTKQTTIALIRLEQFYPFPEEELLKELRKHSINAQYIWCQEEPKNMGGWQFIRPRLEKILEILNVKKKLEYIGRKSSASTAAGHFYAHEKEQKAIINEAVN